MLGRSSTDDGGLAAPGQHQPPTRNRPSPSPGSLLIARAVATACVLLLACDSPTAPRIADTQLPDVTPFVTRDMRGFLDESGHFSSTPNCGRGVETMSADEAEDLAVYFARRFLGSGIGIGSWPPAGEGLSEAHGHSIRWSDAAADVRSSVCAQPVFEPMPPEFSQSTRNHFGPYYLVPIYVGTDQVALIGIGAVGRVFIDESGRLRGTRGNEFRWASSPHGHAYGNPLSPEAAVRIAADQSGALVAELPRLLVPGHNIAPQGARWEIVLDRTVPVTRVTGGAVLDADTIYIGYWSSWIDPVSGPPWTPRTFVAAPIQPTIDTLFVLYTDGSRREVEWPIRDDVPTDFWEVQVSPAALPADAKRRE